MQLWMMVARVATTITVIHIQGSRRGFCILSIYQFTDYLTSAHMSCIVGAIYNNLCLASSRTQGLEAHMSDKYALLRETALLNIELLFHHWKLEYEVLPGGKEYDFRSPARDDRNLGACRFNIEKGRGADFALKDILTKDHIRSLGTGLSISDFSSGTSTGEFFKSGFDIIGLCQRVYGINNYSNGARRLQSDLNEINISSDVWCATAELVKQRQEKLAKANKAKIDYAKRIWHAASIVPFETSLARKYLQSRRIDVEGESSIRAHPGLHINDINDKLPAVLFKVAKSPEGPIEALHRIFLTKDGLRKADIDDPKRAIAKVTGCGIWFGFPGKELWIAEGPEEALSYRVLGADFVVSTISATNYHTLTIPEYVTVLVFAPDTDNAGMLGYKKALISYKRDGLEYDVAGYSLGDK